MKNKNLNCESAFFARCGHQHAKSSNATSFARCVQSVPRILGSVRACRGLKVKLIGAQRVIKLPLLAACVYTSCIYEEREYIICEFAGWMYTCMVLRQAFNAEGAFPGALGG
jgi:hypothetical protein